MRLRATGEAELSAVLTTGDNFYGDEIDLLMQPFQWVIDAGIPFWVTWGNHDIESKARIDGMNDVFDSPPRWTVREWGEIDVVILDSNQVSSIAQGAFFLQTMARSDRPTLVALHHPPYSCSHRGPTTELVNEWVRILDDDVFLVLAGHDHNYQRFNHEDVTYVVTGGGGRSLNPIQDCPANHPPLLAGEELHHFLALSQTTATVEVEVVDVDGDIVDSFSVGLP